jgi:hypothetical protein
MSATQDYVGTSGRRYRLDALLNSGGFGSVYQATCSDDGATYALKTLTRPGLEAVALEQEAQALQSVRHANVVGYVDHGVDPESFLVMEYAPDGTLEESLHQARLDGTPVDIEVTLRWLDETLAGLAAIHEADLIHRDLKPLNLLFSGGVLKVADFGIARIADASTASGTFRGWGSLTYMPPEGWQGPGGPRPTPAYDLYALGVIAFEMLAGRPPFVGDRDALHRGHSFEAPPPLTALRPDAPAQLVTLILALLAKDPARRPQTAEQVRVTLGGIVPAGNGDEDAGASGSAASLHTEAIRRRAAEMATRLSEEEAQNRLRAEHEKGEQEMIRAALANLDSLMTEAVEQFRAAISPLTVSARGENGVWSVRVDRSPRQLQTKMQRLSFDSQNAPGRVVVFGYLNITQDGDELGGANIVGHVKQATPWIVEFQEIRLRNGGFSQPMRPYEPFYIDATELGRHGNWLWGGGMHVFQPAVTDLRVDLLLDWFSDLVV